MDRRKGSRIDSIRQAFRAELHAAERRAGPGRRRTDGVIRIGTALVRAIVHARFIKAGSAANDPAFQTRPARARSRAKPRAIRCIPCALLRKLRTSAARAASPALAGLSGLLAEMVWSVKTITPPQYFLRNGTV